MLTQPEVDGMRATSRSALPDTCTITRPGTGAQIFDPISGDYTGPTAVTVFTGPCRVRPAVNVEQDVQVGDLHETLGRYTATLPWDAGDIRVDDFLVVTAGTDQELVGRPLRVVHVNVGAWEIDRRVVLEDQEQR